MLIRSVRFSPLLRRRRKVSVSRVNVLIKKFSVTRILKKNNEPREPFPDLKMDFPKDNDLIMKPTDKVLRAYELIGTLNYFELLTLNTLLAKKAGLPDPRTTNFQQNYAASSQQPVQTSDQTAQSSSPTTSAAQKTQQQQQQQPQQQQQAAAKGGMPQAPKKKVTYTVTLKKYPEANKFKVLKEVRVLKPGMNLTDSKVLIEQLPALLNKGIPEADIEKWKKLLTSVEAEFDVVQD
eukprot:TRINITY_DN3195_c0_g1_i1.p1 TRINITY_DN3195_c0_g1~~TRINITY_DN3195_c0_g1_i1.p1  ORF type:complete len:236 (-),score=50.74 TRINITY_DN3195_c0_g1_i1:23-730(-)